MPGLGECVTYTGGMSSPQQGGELAETISTEH